MEGFKANPKMKSQLACFREGGYVTKKQLIAFEKKEDKAEEKKDIAEDKKIAKKAISQHEAAQHKGEAKTELKLKGGRRVKKEGGCIKKFKAGGTTNPDGKGKPSGDKDPVKKVKAAPKKAATPSKAKSKAKETPGQEMGTSGDLSAMVAPSAAGPAATAPSPAMALPQDGIQNMAAGRRPWINEEPDDATAPIKKPVRKPKTGAVSDYERALAQAQASGMMQGLGAISDYERAQAQDPGMMQGLGAISDYERSQLPGYAPGGMIPDTVTRAGVGGLGNAINTGPLGAAGSMGAPRNVPLSPQEQDIMRGLQAVGSYCKGGKAY